MISKSAKTSALPISESREHYLAAVLELGGQSGMARMRDISRHVGVRTASATSAVAALAREGLVRHESYGRVELTTAGRRAARRVQRRRQVLLRFLTQVLEVDLHTAERDACRMEHCLSEKSLGRLLRFLEFMDYEKKQAGRLQTLHSFYARSAGSMESGQSQPGAGITKRAVS